FFPIGQAMNKNLTVNMGNCPHRKYLPMLVDLVRNGTIDPTRVLKEEVEPMGSVLEAYRAFDRRMPGWIKVELKPAAVAAETGAATGHADPSSSGPPARNEKRAGLARGPPVALRPAGFEPATLGLGNRCSIP